MGIIKDLKDQKFSRLLVISYAGLDKNRREAIWLCKCDCGNYNEVKASFLKTGNTTSCGCFKIENIKIANTKHGHNRRNHTTPEYIAWFSMKSRCYNDKNKAYTYYGGRGIKVCDRWFESFENFFSDMGERPSSRHSLDRFPDTNGNYEPNNCRWATKKEQANNVRDNKIISYMGERQTLSQWSDELGFNYRMVENRLRKGYSVEESFTVPSGKLKFERKIIIPNDDLIKQPIERSRKPIFQYTKEGVLIKEHYSISQAGRDTGILSTAIKNCVLGLSKSSGGYIWKAV